MQWLLVTSENSRRKQQACGSNQEIDALQQYLVDERKLHPQQEIAGTHSEANASSIRPGLDTPVLENPEWICKHQNLKKDEYSLSAGLGLKGVVDQASHIYQGNLMFPDRVRVGARFCGV